MNREELGSPHRTYRVRLTSDNAMRGAVLILGALLSGLFVFVVVQRFRFPVDVEWMTGAIVDSLYA